jgi:hypothetical protein
MSLPSKPIGISARMEKCAWVRSRRVAVCKIVECACAESSSVLVCRIVESACVRIFEVKGESRGSKRIRSKLALVHVQG